MIGLIIDAGVKSMKKQPCNAAILLKYSKNNNIVKYCYNFKSLFYILINF